MSERHDITGRYPGVIAEECSRYPGAIPGNEVEGMAYGMSY